MKIISVRETPEYAQKATKYIQQAWPEVSPLVYEDCIKHCLDAPTVIPQWYVLEKDGELIGCGGIVTNDFISRMDLYPWLCALFIDEKHRGCEYSSLIMNKAQNDMSRAGFEYLYLCTDHIGFYEKYGYEYIGNGQHPWDEESRIYRRKLG